MTRADLAQDRAAALALHRVSPDVVARLDRFVALLLARQARMNLIAASTIPLVWTRHVADSLQLVGLAPEARVFVDFGSGAGFPGLVIACALAGVPGVEVHLIESIGKKADFLRAAAHEAGAPAIVHHTRIEAFAADFERADIVTARAVAPLVRLIGLAEPLLKRGAKGLFPKGQDVEAELTEASKYWNIEASLIPSKTDPRGRIVFVRRAKRRP